MMVEIRMVKRPLGYSGEWIYYGAFIEELARACYDVGRLKEQKREDSGRLTPPDVAE
jgi:hypothetical protein